MSIAADTVRGHGVSQPMPNPFNLAAGANGAARLSPADDDLKALQQIGVRAKFARNETIFNEGDTATHCYKIVSGAVRLCKHMADGRRQIADFLLPGDLFGFLQPGEYSFTAEAVSDVVVISYPQRQVEALSNRMPSMRKRFLLLLSQRLLGMQDHLMMLGRQTARERVAAFLLLLSERSDAQEEVPFDVPMGRQDMADYLGLTIETVCRVLSDFKRSRLIGIPDLHRIALNDVEGLHGLADGGA